MGAGFIQSLPQLAHHLDEALGQVVPFHRFPILLPSLLGSFPAGFFDPRNLLETDGQGPGADLGAAIAGNQQGSLQEAEAQHQIHMEGRRQRVALIKGLLDGAAGLVQSCVIDRDPDQPAGTVCEGVAQHRCKQGLWLPLATRVEKVFGAPTALLAAVGPDDAG